MLAQREQTHYEELEDHASVNAVHPGDDTVKSHHHGSKVGVDGSNVQSGGAEGGMYLKCVWFMLSTRSSFFVVVEPWIKVLHTHISSTFRNKF
jgi:hypothetical protein